MLSLAGFHLHGTQRWISLLIAGANWCSIFDRGAIELAATSGKPVGTKLARSLEITVNILAGFAFLSTGDLRDGSRLSRYGWSGHGRCDDAKDVVNG